MEQSIEDYLSKIAHYKEEIKEKEINLTKAAVIGNQLLNDKKKLQETALELRTENEQLKQKTYSLELELQAKSLTYDSQSSEFELLHGQYDELVKKFESLQKENLNLKLNITCLKNEKSDYEDLQNVNKALEMKIGHQKEQIEALQQRVESSNNVTIIEDDIEEADLNFYKLKNTQLQEILSGYQIELQNSKLEESRLTHIVNELEESIFEKDKLIKSYFAEIQKAKDESSELKCEIEMLKLQQVDLNRKGNSMFGELDDRRIKVEKHCKLLEKEYKTVSANYENSVKELSYCKSQLSILLSMASRPHQESYIKKLEAQLLDAKENIATLTANLNNAVKLQQQLKDEKPVLKQDDEYNYLRIMYKQSEDKVKALQNEVMALRLQNMSQSDSRSDTQRFLYHCQEELAVMKVENKKLRQQIKAMNSEPASKVFLNEKPNAECPATTVKAMKDGECAIYQSLGHDVTDASPNRPILREANSVCHVSTSQERKTMDISDDVENDVKKVSCGNVGSRPVQMSSKDTNVADTIDKFEGQCPIQ